MRSFIISLIVFVLGAFALSPTVFAVNVFSSTCGTNGTANKTAVCSEVNNANAKDDNPVLVIIKDVMRILSLIIGIASVIVIIVAGFQFIGGGSDPQSITNARNALIYAIVGIAVAVMAETIVVFVLKKVA